MNMNLPNALAQASSHDLKDLAAFLTSKFKVQSLNAESGDCGEVEEEGIVTALNDWAALHGGAPVRKD